MDGDFLRGEQENKSISLVEKRGTRGYTVRHDRRRYFFPNEWNDFIKTFTNRKHKLFFLTALHTGGRVMEVLNLKYKDIDTERGTVLFRVVKRRKAKRTYKATGTTRSFFLASNYLTAFKSYIRGKVINPEHYIFLDNEKLPPDYDSLSNQEKKPYYQTKKTSYSAMMKRHVKQAGIKDVYNFSLHNIRKTYGMYHRTLISDTGELTFRMGHDLDTFLSHYGSSLIFTDSERRQINQILGEVK